jgi:hypothetical protein
MNEAELQGYEVTESDIEARIREINYMTIGTDTVCTIVVDNGYFVIGKCPCPPKINYNPALYQKIARDRAFEKLYPLFAFQQAEARFMHR